MPIPMAVGGVDGEDEALRRACCQDKKVTGSVQDWIAGRNLYRRRQERSFFYDVHFCRHTALDRRLGRKLKLVIPAPVATSLGV